MGARYVVTIAEELDEPARQRARQAIEAELALVDRLMSTWRDDSELSRFNRSEAGVAFGASPETIDVLATAARVSEWSGGAFDVTVGPLVRAWGFGADARVRAVPSDVEIASVRALTSYRHLALDVPRRTVTKARAGVSCDLSSIAPGYAADRVAAALGALGHRHVLVDIGGEIKAVGRRPDGAPWRVGVAWPWAGDGPQAPASAHLAAVALDGLAMATSGDYRDFFVDTLGRRRSHVLDPRTGWPVAHALASVSVVRPSAAEADALATALMVLGPEEGGHLAERAQLAAYFVLRRQDGTFETRQTPPFAALRVE